MKLQELLEKHPHVALATREDNQSLLDFFHSLPMTGKGLQLQYDRSPDFFEFLEQHSDHYFVFLLKNGASIEGVGTLVIKDGFIDGKVTKVGYLGDLRVKSGMKNALRWRNFYQDLMHHSGEIEELFKVKYFQTVVIDSNTSAQTSLVSSKKNAFAYHPLSSYNMINIYLKKPWGNLSHSFKISRAQENERQEIKNFWLESERKKPFGQSSLLDYALTHWKNFDLSQIIIARENSKIVGMTALWSPKATKKIILKRFPPGQKLMASFLRMRASSFPKEGEELSPLYLSLLNVNRPDVLKGFFDFIYQNKIHHAYHMISFPEFAAMPVDDSLKTFIYDKVPMGLYQVYNSHEPNLKLKANLIPGFEMALV